jgi:hypothetical protein
VKRRIEWTERTAMPRVIPILWMDGNIDDNSIRQRERGVGAKNVPTEEAF